MPINKIAYQVLEENQQNYINILRGGQSASDTGWTIYADSAGVNPVDGIGGTASITWAQNTSSPLSGDSDLRLVKDASNRQGDGVSIPFTIANRHLAKVLQISFDMELISGTYATGDLRVSIIQDPSGTSVMLEPVGTSLELGIANQRMREIATFQTHVSVTSYRLCIHVSSTSTSAYTVDFANFKVWEPTQSIGAVITDWVDWVNPTASLVNFGSATISTARFRRVGSDLEFFIRGVSGVASGNSGINLPNGLVANTTSSSTINVGIYTRGISTALSTGFLLATNGSAFLLLGGYINGSSQNDTLSNGGTVFSNTNPFTLQASVPIAGWGSSVAMSSDSGDGRVVAAKYTNTNSTSINPIIWSTREIDTHNAYSNGVFTVPVNGIYRVSISYANSNLGNSIYVLKNGVDNSKLVDLPATGNNYVVGGSAILQANAGNTISVRCSGGSTNSAELLAHISIERISAGSQVIASNEGVSVICRTISNGLTTTPTGISWTSKEVDSHGSFTASTSRFTAPMSGVYQFDLCFRSNNANSGYSQLYDVTNSVILRTSSVPSDSSIMCGQLSSSVRLLAGQIIDVKLSQASGTSTLSSNLYDNYLSITRVGNY